MTKLEAAMMAVGSGSGETSGRPHCQYGVFPRASQEVEKARDAAASAETKLVLEEDAVQQAEERLLVL